MNSFFTYYGDGILARADGELSNHISTFTSSSSRSTLVSYISSPIIRDFDSMISSSELMNVAYMYYGSNVASIYKRIYETETKTLVRVNTDFSSTSWSLYSEPFFYPVDPYYLDRTMYLRHEYRDGSSQVVARHEGFISFTTGISVGGDLDVYGLGRQDFTSTYVWSDFTRSRTNLIAHIHSLFDVAKKFHVSSTICYLASSVCNTVVSNEADIGFNDEKIVLQMITNYSMS